MTKDETLRLALDTLKEVREETFRLLKNGERLYAEDKVWSAIISIQETLEAKDEPSMKVEGPLHVICQCDKCKPQIAFNAEVVGYIAPQRTWVGLTVDEIAELVCNLEDPENRIELGQKIEAKLKERNT